MTEKFYTVEPCGAKKTYEIVLPFSLDLEDVKKKIHSFAEVIAEAPAILIFKYEGRAISLYKSGKFLLKGVNQEQAEKLADRLIEKLGLRP